MKDTIYAVMVVVNTINIGHFHEFVSDLTVAIAAKHGTYNNTNTIKLNAESGVTILRISR